MLELVLYNVVFWTIWIYVSHLPERAMQYVIDNPEKIFK